MKIVVTGSSGLVGKAIKRLSEKYKDIEFIFISSKEGIFFKLTKNL
jgi:dTDP-4-dehydrorhamnose reductase